MEIIQGDNGETCGGKYLVTVDPFSSGKVRMWCSLRTTQNKYTTLQHTNQCNLSDCPHGCGKYEWFPNEMDKHHAYFLRIYSDRIQK